MMKIKITIVKNFTDFIYKFYTQAWHGFKPIGLLIIMVFKAFCYFQMYWLGKVIFVTKTSCTNLNSTIIGNLMEKICQYFLQVILKI